MKVINRNIGTPMLSNCCPKCGVEIFNDSSVKFDANRNCGIKKCHNCGNELGFPNTLELLDFIYC